LVTRDAIGSASAIRLWSLGAAHSTGTREIDRRFRRHVFFFFWRIESTPPEFTTVSPFVMMRATRVILALGLVVASAATASAVNSGNTVYAHVTNGVVTDGSGTWEGSGTGNRRCACSSDAPHFRRVR
jgi:hypothetical protein